MDTSYRKIIEASKFQTYFSESGIVKTILAKNAVISITEARENTVVIGRSKSGEKLGMLLVMSEIRDMTKDARDYLASKERCKRFKAMALVVKTPLSRGIANFFVNVNKPMVPVNIFENEDQATAWLKQYI